MPIRFPHRNAWPESLSKTPHGLRSLHSGFGRDQAIALAILFAALFHAAGVGAQTLARKGWVGSGIDRSPWWQRAVFLELGPQQASPVELARRLDAAHSLADAVILPAPELPPPGPAAQMPDLQGLDDCLRLAAVRHLKILLALPNIPPERLLGTVRFWMSHGIAGVYLTTPPSQSMALSELHSQLSGVLAQRLLITNADLSAGAEASRPARSRVSPVSPHLEVVTLPVSGSVAELSGLLARAAAQPNVLLETEGSNMPAAGADRAAERSENARVWAAIAMLNGSAALISPNAELRLNVDPNPQPETETATPPPAAPVPQQLPAGEFGSFVPYKAPPAPKRAQPVAQTEPPDPLATWYRRLTELHRDNSAIRTGSHLELDLDAQNVVGWVDRPASPTLADPPVFVLCNLSGAPVQLDLTAAVAKLHLRGWFLRTLLRSDEGMGGQNVSAIHLPANGVYIGELQR